MRLGAGSPRMPQAGHKSHANSLTIMSESSRKLHGIYQMRSDIYEETVATCRFTVLSFCAPLTPKPGIERNIPETPVEIKDKYSGYRLTVPDYQAIMPVSFRSPSSTAEYAFALSLLITMLIKYQDICAFGAASPCHCAKSPPCRLSRDQDFQICTVCGGRH